MEIKYFNPGDNFTDASIVRTEVFVNEQKFSKENEFDLIDKTAYHVVIYNDLNEPVATGRIFQTEGKSGEYTLGRVAVLKNYRGQNLGALLMKSLEKKAKEIGATSLYLGAQDHACKFYEKLGYNICGEQYMDEHTVHFPMSKNI